ncbi:MAG TPA: TatD family hydrolase [Anaerolineae bacterium]|nr:TatD family hydrolase [Anaerolineae bacterium]HPL27490.1 TatD family hydrolase [Anaerolineae bacterium]
MCPFRLAIGAESAANDAHEAACGSQGGLCYGFADTIYCRKEAQTLVDTHAHLAGEAYDADREQVLRRAAEAGVSWIVDVGADRASSMRAVALSESEPRVWAAVGVHPHDAATLDAATIAELRALAGRSRVVAIGEIGLDYYRDLAPRETQRRAFAQQLALALELGLPVIVHDREAHDDTLAILRAAAARHGGSLRGVMHCFSGDAELAQHVVALGLYIGIAGPVTYPRTVALADVVRQAPLERLLVETDSPYLAPQSRRGRRNEPAYVRQMAERVAELRALSFEEVARATSSNARALFGVDMLRSAW